MQLYLPISHLRKLLFYDVKTIQGQKSLSGEKFLGEKGVLAVKLVLEFFFSLKQFCPPFFCEKATFKSNHNLMSKLYLIEMTL